MGCRLLGLSVVLRRGRSWIRGSRGGAPRRGGEFSGSFGGGVLIRSKVNGRRCYFDLTTKYSCDR